MRGGISPRTTVARLHLAPQTHGTSHRRRLLRSLRAGGRDIAGHTSAGSSGREHGQSRVVGSDMLTLRYRAGDVRWHTLDLVLPETGISSGPVLWVIYIHGGAWRDPKQTSTEGHRLLANLPARSGDYLIARASINYRLSTDDASVRHPAHVDDVSSALSFLAANYSLERCVLVGHSCGATLALQVYPKHRRMIYGFVLLNGIYDLEALVEEYPEYNGFVEAAFGPLDRTDWRSPSPTAIIRDMSVPAEHRTERFLVCHSPEDELLSMAQSNAFLDVLHDVGVPYYEFVELMGKHDDSPGSEQVSRIVNALLASSTSAGPGDEHGSASSEP